MRDTLPRYVLERLARSLENASKANIANTFVDRSDLALAGEVFSELLEDKKKETGTMKPGKVELLGLAKRLDVIQPRHDVCASAAVLTRTGQILRELAAEQEPEEPQVETLLASALKNDHKGLGCSERHARSSAIVLRRVDRVWKWIEYNINKITTSEQAEIDSEREAIEQMLTGSE